MMRSALRAATGIGALGVALLAAPIPAHADGEYLRVTPSTVQAGFPIEIEGFCGNNVDQAAVKSDAFGVVTITSVLDPRTHRHLHRGTATIPTNKSPMAYPVTMTCPSNQTATTTLHVVNFNVPPKGPMTGGGGVAGNSLLTNAFTLVGVGGLALGSLLLLWRRKA